MSQGPLNGHEGHVRPFTTEHQLVRHPRHDGGEYTHEKVALGQSVEVRKEIHRSRKLVVAFEQGRPLESRNNRPDVNAERRYAVQSPRKRPLQAGRVCAPLFL